MIYCVNKWISCFWSTWLNYSLIMCPSVQPCFLSSQLIVTHVDKSDVVSSHIQAEAAGDPGRCGWFHGVRSEFNWAHAESEKQSRWTILLCHCVSFTFRNYCNSLPPYSCSGVSLKETTSCSSFGLMSPWLMKISCPCLQSDKKLFFSHSCNIKCRVL